MKFVSQYRLPRGWPTKLLWLVVVVLTGRLLLLLPAAAKRPSSDFLNYYTAARLWHEGQAVAHFYDNDWYGRQSSRFLPGFSDIYAPHPPTTALIVAPLAWGTYAQSRSVWLMASFACLITALILLLRMANWRDWRAPAFLILCLIYQPIYENFVQAQAYLIVLFLLTLAYIFYHRQQEPWLGITLAVMLLFKLSLPFLWLLLLVQRRWHALAWGMGTAAAGVIVTLPWLTFSAWRTFANVIVHYNDKPWLGLTAYQTQHSFWHHLLAYEAQWNPQPWRDWPWLADGLTWLGLAALLGAALYVAYKLDNNDLSFGLTVIVSLVLTPVTLGTHYALLLLPLFLLANRLWKRPFSPSSLLFLLAFALIALDLPYRSPALQAGLWALLAYPKLYGALILCGLYGLLAYRLRQPDTAVYTQAQLERERRPDEKALA
jgi:hypothetical protein